MLLCAVALNLSCTVALRSTCRFGVNSGAASASAWAPSRVSSQALSSRRFRCRFGLVPSTIICAVLSTVLELIRMPSGADSGTIGVPFRALCRAQFGALCQISVGRHFGTCSGAIRTRHGAPFVRSMECHSGTASSAIRAKHRAPFGRGIVRHSGAISKAISSAV